MFTSWFSYYLRTATHSLTLRSITIFSIWDTSNLEPVNDLACIQSADFLSRQLRTIPKMSTSNFVMQCRLSGMPNRAYRDTHCPFCYKYSPKIKSSPTLQIVCLSFRLGESRRKFQWKLKQISKVRSNCNA